MKTYYNILKKLFLILLLAVGWGSVHAERLAPDYVSSLNLDSDNWYYVRFQNNGNYMHAQEAGFSILHGSRAENAKQDPNYLWQLVGDDHYGFKFVSMNGVYAYWLNGTLTGVDNDDQAQFFELQAGNDADSWGVKVFAGTTNQFLNPQSGNLIKTWSNDGGSRIRFEVPTAADIETARHTVKGSMLGNSVRLVFQDGEGNPLPEANPYVNYTAEGGAIAVLSSADSPYNFGGVHYHAGAFSGYGSNFLSSVHFDSEQQVLTFTLTSDPNLLLFSDAPAKGQWADDTKWYYVRNNRSNINATWQLKYLTTSAQGVRDDYSLTVENLGRDVLPTDRGGVWCFVGDNTNGFYIQNAAYGPDFALAYVNSQYRMVLIDEAPDGAVVKFRYNDGAVKLAGENHAYAFLHGTSGNTVIHIDDNDMITSTFSGDDTGKSFKVTAVSAEQLEALPAYDVYRMHTLGVPTGVAVDYTPLANTFGKRSSAKNGDFLILQHGSAHADENFTIADDDYVLGGVALHEDDTHTHTYKILTLSLHDKQATEEFDVVVLDRTAAQNIDVDNIYVEFHGIAYQNGDAIYTRPKNLPHAIDFDIDYSGTFIWGPAIDAKAKKVTFEIRDLATNISAFDDGFFQLMLKNEADVTTVNGLIAGTVGNGNIQSNLIYLMPAKGEAYSNRPFKFSGIESSNQAPSFIHVTKKSNNTYTLSYANGRSMDVNVSAFADGVVTLNKAISTNNAEPYDMPYFYGNGSTQFYVSPANLDDYYVYKLAFAGDYDASTTLSTTLDVLNGLTKFKSGDFIMLRKGTMLAKSDFTPSNARVSSLAVTPADPANGQPYSILTLTVEAVQDEWTCNIKTTHGSGIDTSNYKIVYGGVEYADGDAISLKMGTVPAAIDLKTTCNDYFVWGPVIDVEERTITFDIRPTVNSLADLQSGFYQLQLYDEYALTVATPTAAMASVEKANNRMKATTVNTKSNYLYVMPYSDYCTSTANRTLKYNGVPNYADEAYSYIYITRESDDKITIQQLDGRYPGTTDERVDGSPSTTKSTISTSNIVFSAPTDKYGQTAHLMGFKGWVIDGLWTSTDVAADNNGPRVAYGSAGTLYESYFVTRPVISNYRVYRIVSGIDDHVVRYSVGPHNYLSNNLHDGSFIFVDSDKLLPAHGAFTCQTTTDVLTYTIGDAVDGIFPITIDAISADVTNTVIHRQHGAYDVLESLDPSLRPRAEDGFIQVGQGMEEKTITTSEGPKTIMVQHASNFEIDLYCKPGESVKCLIPATQNETNAYNHMGAFQRWYDYDTELPLPSTVATFPASYKEYTNGHVGRAFNGNTALHKDNSEYLPVLNVTLPAGVDVLNVGCDTSDFADGGPIGSGDDTNYLEPSLGFRLIYHIHNANLIAQELKDVTAAGGFLEEKEFLVPNVKYGREGDSNKGDLIPLDLAWSNYWMYSDAAGTTLTQLISESTATSNADFKKKVVVELDSKSQEYGLRVEVLGGDVNKNGKIGAASSTFSKSCTNHFIYYYINNTNTRNEIPADHEATITVKIKTSTKNSALTYNLARFKLKFIANAEPLALTRVIGPDADNPISDRSVDYFVKQGYQEIASLTFQQKELPYTTPQTVNGDDNSHRNAYKNFTYGIPFEFSKASYAYTYGNTWAACKVARLNYGLKYNPVSLYEYNIKHPESTKYDITDDYFLYVDAAEQPGQVASIPLEGNLCAGSRLYCYGWLGSTNIPDNGSASVVINLIGRRPDGTSKVLASYLPGTVSNVTYDENSQPVKSYIYGRTNSPEQGTMYNNTIPDNNEILKNFGAWQQIGFSTILSEVGYESYEIQIVNNCYTTSGGDYCLDDFRIFMKPPSAVVDFSTPVCSDEIEHIKIHTPFELLEDAATTADGKSYKVNYSFIDKAIYYDYFDEHCTIVDDHGRHPGDTGYKTTYRTFTQEDYNNAFNAALMGSGTDTESADHTKAPSFWNITVNKDFETLEHYHFANIVTGVLEGEAYRETVAGEKRVVMKRSIRPAERWTPGREYIVVFAKGWVESDFTHAATNVYSLDHNCSFLSEFTIRPAIMVNSDVEYTAADALQACDGQSASMSICMIGVGPDGEKYKDRMNYDWWIGYGKGSSDPDVASTTTNSDVIPATVDNFLRLQWPAGTGSYLDKALDHFRACYTYATTLEGCPPCKAPEIYGDEYDFTKADYDCIAHYLRPNDLGRVPLILGRNAFNTRLESKDAVIEDGDRNIYITIIPITPISAYDADDNVIYCPAPQQVKVRLVGDAPSMIDGFGALTYPSDIQSIPVRAGIKQIEATKMNAAGVATNFLRVPLRNVKTVNASELVVDKYSDGGELLDYVYLSGCDDPNYTDEYIAEVKDNILKFIPVGRVRVYSAKGRSKEAYMEIAFSEDFQPREGYTYTLKSRFAEEPVAGMVTPCPGSLFFDLKIVPEYQQWTATTGSEYTNDNNWARSDYDVLHAGESASDGTKPLAGYTTNAKNYEKDARYVAGNEKSAHGFTPMYFTNILMREPNCLAPAIYPMTKAPVGYPYTATTSSATGDFLQGLSDDATNLIQYDMLVTPIDASNKPLPLAQRYASHSGNYGCEPFWTNICDGLTFEPATMMYDAQYLNYRRAWVEYELDTNRWYTLASPLQDVYAGEWYSPEAGGRQLTPHFYPVTYNEALNDRFHPAYYQRSWDKAGDAWIYSMPGDDNAYLGFTTQASPYGGNKRVTRPVLLNWGYVYNDVEVPYSQGGFSVNARYKDAPSVLVRMPKDDDAYFYYESEDAAAAGNANSDGTAMNPDGSNANPARPNGNGVYKGDYTTLSRTGHHRLMSDLLVDAEGHASSIGQYLQNRSRVNPYYLVGNPLMAPLDMDAFFGANTAFNGGKYWIMSADCQTVSIKVGDSWISTTGDGGAVAPLQSFFVSLPTDTDGNAVLPAGSNGGVSLAFDASMQKPLEQIGEDRDGSPIYGFVYGEDSEGTPFYGHKPQLRSQVAAPAATFRIHAATNGKKLSTAVVYFSDQTSNAYRPTEDAETLLDGNTANTVSTVFTYADEQALQINSMSTAVDIIPIGVIAPTEQTTTVLSFSGVNCLSNVMAETPYLYDAEDDVFTILDADTQFTVTGTTVGRYFVVSGGHLPLVDESADKDSEQTHNRYNLNGVRVRTPQHGTVTISAGRKEYAK